MRHRMRSARSCAGVSRRRLRRLALVRPPLSPTGVGDTVGRISSLMIGGSSATSTAFGRHGTRLYACYAQSSRVSALGAVLMALAGAWVGSYLLGGSRSPGPHLFYVAIALAAVRFEWLGGVVAAVAGGLLAGSLLPADVESMTPQNMGEWLLRSVVFVAFAVFIAALVEGPHPPIRGRLHDAV